MIKREDIIAEVLRDRPAMESAIRLLEEKVLRRRCDSDGVNCCIRCNTNFVVARMKDLLALAAAPAPSPSPAQGGAGEGVEHG